MRKLFGVVAALLMVAGSSAAQVTIDNSTRTITAVANASNPGTSYSYANGALSGSLDTHALAGETAYLVFQFTGLQSLTTASGITNPNASVFPVTSDVTFGAGTAESRIDGYGLHSDMFEFINPYAQPFTPTAFTPYSIFVRVGANVQGQSDGAQATAIAGVTLSGVDAEAANGQVVSTAVFDRFGNGVFAATVPEPSSLALLGSGLLGVLPFVRKQRRA